MVTINPEVLLKEVRRNPLLFRSACRLVPEQPL
jgi:hypothetical protein